MSNALNPIDKSSRNMLKKKAEPPLALVDTWVWMMSNSKEPSLQEVGKERLVDAFGDLHSANVFYNARK